MQLSKFQKTKIVATVGPSSSSYEVLLELARAGVDVFRLNFSHGDHEDHQKVIDHITAINKEFKSSLCILADLQGPKLRIGKMEDGGLKIQEGDILTFTNEECIGNKEKIYMSYSQFAKDVKVGEKVLIDDGKIEMQVMETNGKDTVKLKVLFGSMLSSNKGVNLPDTDISLPSLTEKDQRDLDFILTQPVNWIALSFVRSAGDILDLQTKILDKGHKAKIIAKIEKPEAIRRLSTIIKVTDGVMVARGDLGVEVPMERLPMLQKRIINHCVKWGKPVIVATQMMDSMITNPSPTRAEIIDVANAVLDGADAVMLSGETSVGRHPVKVVQSMNRIIAQAELDESIYYRGKKPKSESPTFLSDAICYNSCKIAREVNANSIIGMTVSGYTAFMISSNRPKCDVFIFSDQIDTLSTLSLVWGIRGFYYDKFTTTDETVADVLEILKNAGYVQKGDVVVNTGSMPLEARLRTNMLKISVVD
ncbi:MAG: pyruvate kinase [Bacteroidota bacterium]